MKKNWIRFLCGTILSLALMFSFAACGDDAGGGNGGGSAILPTDDDPYVTELTVVTPPANLEYRVGETFDPTGAFLKALWSHGEEEDLYPAECTISPTGPLTADVTEITFTYEGVSCTQAIRVIDVQATGIRLDRSALAEKQLTGTVDLTQIVVTVAYADGSENRATSYTILENDTEISDPARYELTAGLHSFTVVYGNYRESFDVTGFAGYLLDATNIVYTEVLEADRDAYIGTNFLENPAAAVYDAPSGGNPVITGTNVKGYLSDGTSINFPTGKYYRAGTEQGVKCLQDVKNGQVMRFHIWSDFDATVDLYLNAAGGYMIESLGETWTPTKMGDMQFNRLFDVNLIEVDAETNRPVLSGGAEVKQKIAIADDVILPGGENPDGDMKLWANFVSVPFGEIDLKKGDNIIELTVVSDYVNNKGASCAANVAGFEVRFVEEEAHEHDLEKTDETLSTCVTHGHPAYWTCKVCGRNFADEQGQTRIYAIEEYPLAAHTPGPEATETEPQKCTVCGVVLKPALEEKQPAVKIQAEDTSAVSCYRSDNATAPDLKWEYQTATQNWSAYVPNGAEGTALSGIESVNGWQGGTIRIKVSVTEAGPYRFSLRGASNGSDQGTAVLDLSGIMSVCVNPEGDYADWTFTAAKGEILPSTTVGNWHQMFYWTIATLGEVNLNVGENTVVLKINDDARYAPNIDWFMFEKAERVEEAETAIVSMRADGMTFAQNDAGTNGFITGLYLRIAVPASEKEDGVFADYYDEFLTGELLEAAGFSTAEVGTHTMTVTLEKFGQTYTASCDYTVTA